MIYGEEYKSKYKIEYNGEKFSKDLLSYKVIIIGRYGVGKTTIINKLMGKASDGEYAPTMTIDIKNIQAKVNDKIIQINIWDCCGNEKFGEETPQLFKNASIVILAYAINDKQSYDALKNWYNILKIHTYESIIFLIGNKSGLEKEREVTIEDADNFKNEFDDIKIFFETSALYDNNMDKLLENIAISIYEKDINDNNITRNTITLNKDNLTKDSKEKGEGEGEGEGEGKGKKKKVKILKINMKILKYFLKLQPKMVKILINSLKILQFQYMKKLKMMKKL